MLASDKKQVSGDFATVPYVELSFGVVGETLPADHGYGLYSAISKQCSDLHNLPGLAINTISGKPNNEKQIELTETSRLRLRCPSSAIMHVLSLSGKSLGLGSHHVRLGDPKIFQVRAYSELKARLVAIKHPSGRFDDITPEWFLDACDRQLKALGIEAAVGIPLDDSDEPAKKAMRIKRKDEGKQKGKKRETDSVVGYSVIVANLLPEDSILLQARGIGGKRKMGCGYFVPYRLK
jgi:CRISPR-associated protein Cas6